MIDAQIIENDQIVGLDEDISVSSNNNFISVGFIDNQNLYQIPLNDKNQPRFICGMIKELINNDSTCKHITIPDIPTNFTCSYKEKFNAFKYIIEYMMTYATDVEEANEPDRPIDELKIKNWLDNEHESKLFHRFVKIDDKNISTNKTHIKELGIIALFASWLQMDKLLNKACALLASYYRGKNKTEMTELTSVDNVIAFPES